MTSAVLPASALRHVSDVMVVKPYGILGEDGEEAGLGVGQDRGRVPVPKYQTFSDTPKSG